MFLEFPYFSREACTTTHFPSIRLPSPRRRSIPPGSLNGSGNCINTCGLVSRFGNAPNGLIRALNVWQIDLALTKETKLTERVSMKFGAQIFNIFNHVQYGDPNPNNIAFNYTKAMDSLGNPIPITGYFNRPAASA